MCMGYWFYTRIKSHASYSMLAEHALNSVNAVGAWLAFGSVMLSIWETSMTYVVSGGVLFLGPLIIAITFTNQTVGIVEMIGQTPKNENEEYICCLGLVRLVDKVKKKTRDGDIISRAFLSFHNTRCWSPNCPLTHISKELDSYTTIDPKKYLNSLSLYTQKTLQSAALRYPLSPYLRNLYVGFLLNYTSNHVEAWAMIRALGENIRNIIEDFEAYTFTRYIKRSCTGTGGGFDSLIAILQLKNERKFMRKIENNAVLYRQFWDILEEKTPRYDAFEKVGFAILQGTQELEALWCDFKARNTIVAGSLYLYSAYCTTIERDAHKATEIHECMQQSRVIYNGNLLSISKEMGLISVRGNLEELGFVKQYNAAFSSMFGYNKEELINTNIVHIIPSIYKKAHDNGIREAYHAIESGKTVKLTENQVFVIVKTHNIIPATMKILELPSYANENLFIASLAKSKLLMAYDTIHVLMDTQFNIQGVTANCELYIGVTAEMIQGNNYNISKVMPAFTSYAEGIMKFETVQERDFRLIYKKIETRKHELLGYHLQMTVVESEKLEFSPNRFKEGPEIEFIYNNEIGKYIKVDRADPNCERKLTEKITKMKSNANNLSRSGIFFILTFSKDSDQSTGSQHSGDKNKKNRKKSDSSKSEDEEQGVFYTEMMARALELFKKDGDDYLVKKIKGKPNLEKGIITYRMNVDKGQFVLADSAKNDLLVTDALENIAVESSQKRSAKIKKLGMKRIFKTTLKNKGYLIKLLEGLPLPLTFNVTLAFSIFCMIVVIVIALVQYIVSSDLFQKIASQMDIFYLQIASFSDLTEISSVLLQAVAYN